MPFRVDSQLCEVETAKCQRFHEVDSFQKAVHSYHIHPINIHVLKGSASFQVELFMQSDGMDVKVYCKCI